MIKRMLDTNICIYIAKKHPPEVIYNLAKYRKGELVLSAITWSEFCCGLSKEGKGAADRLLEYLEIIPFCRKSAETYAQLTIRYPNRKACFDRLIAAHAIAIDVPLVSNNTADFALYHDEGLKLENWTFT